MEPNTPPLQPQLPQQSKPRFSKKILLIVAGVVVLLIALLLFVLPGGKDDSKKKGSDSKTDSLSDLYYQREGYADLSTGIGDAQALYFKPGNSSALDYQGTKVIQACNVLTIDDVRATGFKTRAYQILGNGFERNYFDGQGKGVLPASDYSLPDDTESNYCKYGVETTGSITVDVYQEPHAKVSGLTDAVRRMTKRPNPIGENNVYERQTSDNSKEYIIGKGSTAAAVSFLGVPIDKHEAIIKKVSDNLTAQKSNPTGAPKVVFESPLLDGKPYADACDLLTPGTIKKFFNAEASPLVKQTFANSVGVISYDKQDGSKIYDNYVMTECERGPVKTEADIENFNRRYITIEAQTFRSELGAQTDMVFLKQYNKNSRSAQSAGTDAFFTKEPGGETLHVRQGRVVLALRFTNKNAKLSVEQTSQILIELSKEPIEALRKLR